MLYRCATLIYYGFWRCNVLSKFQFLAPFSWDFEANEKFNSLVCRRNQNSWIFKGYFCDGMSRKLIHVKPVNFKIFLEEYGIFDPKITIIHEIKSRFIYVNTFVVNHHPMRFIFPCLHLLSRPIRFRDLILLQVQNQENVRTWQESLDVVTRTFYCSRFCLQVQSFESILIHRLVSPKYVTVCL